LGTAAPRTGNRGISASFTEKPAPDQVIEIAAVGDDSFARSLGYYSGDIQLNPDPILRSQAGSRGVDLFQEMEDKDPNIFSDLQTRKLAVIGLDWEIIPASQDAGDVAAAEFMGDVLDGLRGFSDDLRELLDAVGKGYAISEILWSARPDGRIGIAEIKSRHQRRFVFDKDGALRLLTEADLTAGNPVPPRKFLVHTFQAEHENPYGRGVLSRVYWYYWFKKNAMKFWALYAEKFGGPTAVGKYPAGTDSGPRAALLSALRAIQQETAVTIPANMTIEFLEAQRRGSIDTYSEFLAYLDRQETKAILGQTLTSGEGERSGSLALGRVHAEVRQDILEADTESLRGVLNSQLIPWLVDWNFIVAAYPKFIFKLDPPEDLVQLATRDRTLQAMGVPIPRSYVQRRYGIPEPEGPDDVLEATVTGIGTGIGFGEGHVDRIFHGTDRLLRRRGR
jgi:phage gp29-like protein